MPGNESYVEGRRLFPRLVIGCLLFAAVMGFGIYGLGRVLTPYLRHKNDEYLRTHRPPGGPAMPKR
jgi:hypothetical protein